MNTQEMAEFHTLKELVKDVAAVFLHKRPPDIIVTCAKPTEHSRRSQWLAGIFVWQEDRYCCVIQVGQDEERFNSRRDACMGLLKSLEKRIYDDKAFEWEDEKARREVAVKQEH